MNRDHIEAPEERDEPVAATEDVSEALERNDKIEAAEQEVRDSAQRLQLAITAGRLGD